VFESSFSEGKPSDRPDGRKIINTKEGFETLHTIFHYIYTERIFLATSPQMKCQDRTPCYLTPEEIYAVAHRFQLIELQKIVLYFLSYSCDQKNIVRRTFDDFALLYDEVGNIYEEQLMKCAPGHGALWSELEEYFKKLGRGEGSEKLAARLHSVLGKIYLKQAEREATLNEALRVRPEQQQTGQTG
jgi:hypothetical protein